MLRRRLKPSHPLWAANGRLGSLLEALRETQGLTRREAADLAGASYSMLRQIEERVIDVPRAASEDHPGKMPVDRELWESVLAPGDGVRVLYALGFLGDRTVEWAYPLVAFPRQAAADAAADLLLALGRVNVVVLPLYESYLETNGGRTLDDDPVAVLEYVAEVARTSGL